MYPGYADGINLSSQGLPQIAIFCHLFCKIRWIMVQTKQVTADVDFTELIAQRFPATIEFSI